jgi:hypothetical protein
MSSSALLRDLCAHSFATFAAKAFEFFSTCLLLPLGAFFLSKVGSSANIRVACRRISFLLAANVPFEIETNAAVIPERALRTTAGGWSFTYLALTLALAAHAL